jgi:hypothetical protein
MLSVSFHLKSAETCCYNRSTPFHCFVWLSSYDRAKVLLHYCRHDRFNMTKRKSLDWVHHISLMTVSRRRRSILDSACFTTSLLAKLLFLIAANAGLLVFAVSSRTFVCAFFSSKAIQVGGHFLQQFFFLIFLPFYKIKLS